jgi:hypothetical protein
LSAAVRGVANLIGRGEGEPERPAAVAALADANDFGNPYLAELLRQERGAAPAAPAARAPVVAVVAARQPQIAIAEVRNEQGGGGVVDAVAGLVRGFANLVIRDQAEAPRAEAREAHANPYLQYLLDEEAAKGR